MPTFCLIYLAAMKWTGGMGKKRRLELELIANQENKGKVYE